MSKPRAILFEGYTDDEILALPQKALRELVLTGEPIVLRIGTATILGEFKVLSSTLYLELAQIEGGGEGVLLVLGTLARRYAQLSGLSKIKWVVHAIHCAQPNLKLRRVIERRGFTICDIDGVDAYAAAKLKLVWGRSSDG